MPVDRLSSKVLSAWGSGDPAWCELHRKGICEKRVCYGAHLVGTLGIQAGKRCFLWNYDL